MTGGFLGRRLPHFLFLRLRGAAVTLKGASGGGNLRSSGWKNTPYAITSALPSLYGRITVNVLPGVGEGPDVATAFSFMI